MLVWDEVIQKNDYMAMNFFAFDEHFFTIKPKHYCLMDPMFFQDSWNGVKVIELFEIFQNKINWEMFLYIPSNRFDDFSMYSGIRNNQIKIFRVNTNIFSGFEHFRFLFYKKNFAMPRPQTVANLAIYAGLNCEYKEIKLYGLDHSYFDSLSVNNENILCTREAHFYDKNVAVKPILNNDTGIPFKVSEYLFCIGHMFKSHDLLAEYAKLKKASITNCTPNSMVDSYKRCELVT